MGIDIDTGIQRKRTGNNSKKLGARDRSGISGGGDPKVANAPSQIKKVRIFWSAR